MLLKNVNNALPLKKPRVLSLFGYDAGVAPTNNPSNSDLSLYNFGLQSLNATLSDVLQFLLGTTQSPPGTATRGTLLGGGGSGAITSSYWSDPYSAIADQAYEDDTFLYWDFQNQSPDVAVTSDVCLVFINEAASEGLDRPSLADADSDTLVNNVASRCPNTIVVIHNAWVRIVDQWYDNPNITGLIFAHLPGQESGRALVDVLYGRNGHGPSGRLPYTVARSSFSYGPLLAPCKPGVGTPEADPHCFFYEGTNVDYRYFLEHDIEPRFPFGFGLTYSNFSYSDISAEWLVIDPPSSPPNPQVLAPGGITSLFDPIAMALATVQNTGAVAAAEVPQLYVQFPGEEKVRVLRGFSKARLEPGESKPFQFELTRRDLSRWNTVTQSWELPQGDFGIHVGSDVLDIKLNSTLSR